MVIVECEEETIPKLSTFIFNDLEWFLNEISRIRLYSTSNNSKINWYNIELYLQWKTNSKSIDRRHFQWAWTTFNPNFKVSPLFEAEYLYEIFKRVISNDWVTLSDLATYLTTRSIVRLSVRLSEANHAICLGSGWVGLCAWLRAEVVYPSKDGHPPRH